MPKLTIEDLARIRKETERLITLRQGAGRVKIVVHMGTCGIAAGAREIMAAVLEEVEQRMLTDVVVTNAGCAGLCRHEPIMTVQVSGEPTPVQYVSMTPAKVRKIIEEHVLRGHAVTDYALAAGTVVTR